MTTIKLTQEEALRRAEGILVGTLNKIQETLDAPLVWLPTEDVGDRCVVVGKVAAELYPPENMPIGEGRSIYFQLCDEWVGEVVGKVEKMINTKENKTNED